MADRETRELRTRAAELQALAQSYRRMADRFDTEALQLNEVATRLEGGAQIGRTLDVIGRGGGK